MLNLKKRLRIRFQADFHKEERIGVVFSMFEKTHNNVTIAKYLSGVVQRVVVFELFQRNLCTHAELVTTVERISTTKAELSCQITIRPAFHSIFFILFWLPTFRLTNRFLSERYLGSIIIDIDKAFEACLANHSVDKI